MNRMKRETDWSLAGAEVDHGDQPHSARPYSPHWDPPHAVPNSLQQQQKDKGEHRAASVSACKCVCE
jgi:hypothetical protein